MIAVPRSDTSTADRPKPPPASVRKSRPADETASGERSSRDAFDTVSHQALESHSEFSRDLLRPAEAADELGRLGPFRVLKVLGSGGMGMVFKAEDPQLRRLVALKVMLPSRAKNSLARERFLREARAAAAIEHDHIIPIYHVDQDRGMPYLAMPMLKGQPFDEVLKKNAPLPNDEVARIARQICLGLDAAHEVGLIHRDVKPANLWIEADSGRVKILDFGLARSADDGDALTQQGAIVGTPAYMAPEQARGKEVDARSDLFSVGCLLYEAATGERPFRGADTMGTLMAIASHAPPAPASVRPEVTKPLSDLIMRLLEKDPDDRPSSAREVIACLDGAKLSHRGTPVVKLAIAGSVAAGAGIAIVMLTLLWNRGPATKQVAPNQDAPVVVAKPPEEKPKGPQVVMGAKSDLQETLTIVDADANPAAALAFDHTGKIFASAHGGKVNVWETRTGKLLGSWGEENCLIDCLVFSPDNLSIAAGSDQGLKLIDARSFRGKHVDPKGKVGAVAFSPDGTGIVVALAEPKRLGSLHWIDREKATDEGSFALTPGQAPWTGDAPILAIGFLEAARHRAMFATIDARGAACTWDAKTRSLAKSSRWMQRDADGFPYLRAGFDLSSNSWLAVSSAGDELSMGRAAAPFIAPGKIYFHLGSHGADINGAPSIAKLETKCTAAVYPPNSKRVLVGGGDGSLSVYLANSAERLVRLKGEGTAAPINALAVARDGDTFAAGIGTTLRIASVARLTPTAKSDPSRDAAAKLLSLSKPGEFKVRLNFASSEEPARLPGVESVDDLPVILPEVAEIALGHRLVPEAIRSLAALPSVQSIRDFESRWCYAHVPLELSEELFGLLEAAPKLKSLHLAAAQYPEGSLKRLGKIKQLTSLDLSWSRSWKDQDLLDLVKALPRLESLSLIGNPVTDDMLPTLQEMKSLRTLDLDCTEVTDKGLTHLEKMPWLRQIVFDDGGKQGARPQPNSKVTPEAAARLRKALPATEIVYR